MHGIQFNPRFSRKSSISGTYSLIHRGLLWGQVSISNKCLLLVWNEYLPPHRLFAEMIRHLLSMKANLQAQNRSWVQTQGQVLLVFRPSVKTSLVYHLYDIFCQSVIFIWSITLSFRKHLVTRCNDTWDYRQVKRPCVRKVKFTDPSWSRTFCFPLCVMFVFSVYCIVFLSKYLTCNENIFRLLFFFPIYISAQNELYSFPLYVDHDVLFLVVALQY